MAARQLSHHEIWDDTALVQSWNDALEEYKKYHSIAARGERVEHVLDAAEKTEEVRMSTGPDHPVDETTGLPAWQSVDNTGSADGVASGEGAQDDERKQAEPTSAPQGANPGPAPRMPQAIINSDENLKNLMMSWYYAGYYTGLYEGQQKSQNAQQDVA